MSSLMSISCHVIAKAQVRSQMAPQLIQQPNHNQKEGTREHDRRTHRKRDSNSDGKRFALLRLFCLGAGVNQILHHSVPDVGGVTVAVPWNLVSVAPYIKAAPKRSIVGPNVGSLECVRCHKGDSQKQRCTPRNNHHALAAPSLPSQHSLLSWPHMQPSTHPTPVAFLQPPLFSPRIPEYTHSAHNCYRTPPFDGHRWRHWRTAPTSRMQRKLKRVIGPASCFHAAGARRSGPSMPPPAPGPPAPAAATSPSPARTRRLPPEVGTLRDVDEGALDPQPIVAWRRARELSVAARRCGLSLAVCDTSGLGRVQAAPTKRSTQRWWGGAAASRPHSAFTRKRSRAPTVGVQQREQHSQQSRIPQPGKQEKKT